MREEKKGKQGNSGNGKEEIRKKERKN